ncbi:hypothetical protein BOX15_Mlig013731g1 [Macrostomum lignano]|uniref:SAP domain-containing protein n=1 Tax=Macrostomum lignano TaxID=282301 RepID=A0A267F9N3_9PLAT|nr:hypothetical protein BOX15_Mlig013731g1 [Macrostomum lignano]
MHEEGKLENAPPGLSMPSHLAASAGATGAPLNLNGDPDDLTLWESSPQGTVESTPIHSSLESTKARVALHLNNRPDRRRLVDYHILIDTASNPGVSPILHEAQKQLKKQKLRDELNSKLAARPGALEVAEKGYLPLSMGAQTLLKDGCIPFTKVADGFADTAASSSGLPVLGDDSLSASSPPPPLPAPVSASATVLASASSSVLNTTLTAAAAAGHATSSTATPSSSRRRAGGAAKVGKKTPNGPNSSQRIEKFGGLTFHQYVPPGPANRCREDQQRMYLRMEAERSRLMDELLTEMAGPSGAAPGSGRLDQHLSSTQLRAECSKRGLKRSGTKEQLAAQLEPYRRELAAAYGFPCPPPPAPPPPPPPPPPPRLAQSISVARGPAKSDSSTSGAASAASAAAVTNGPASIGNMSALGYASSSLARSSSEGAALQQLQYQQQQQQRLQQSRLAYCLVPVYLDASQENPGQQQQLQHPIQQQQGNSQQHGFAMDFPAGSFVVSDLRSSMPSSSTGNLRAWLASNSQQQQQQQAQHPHQHHLSEGGSNGQDVSDIDLLDQLIRESSSADSQQEQMLTATPAVSNAYRRVHQQHQSEFQRPPQSPMQLDGVAIFNDEPLAGAAVGSGYQQLQQMWDGDPPLMHSLAAPSPMDVGSAIIAADMDIDLDISVEDYCSPSDSVFIVDA